MIKFSDESPIICTFFKQKIKYNKYFIITKLHNFFALFINLINLKRINIDKYKK